MIEAPDECPHCFSAGEPLKNRNCGCIDYGCGSAYLCDSLFPEPEGFQRSQACKIITAGRARVEELEKTLWTIAYTPVSEEECARLARERLRASPHG